MAIEGKVVSPSITHKRGERKKYKAFEDDDMETNNFDSGSEPKLDIICNMISMLPLEYDTITTVFEEEGLDEELSSYKPMCYYVMNESSFNKGRAIFERPYMAMQ